MWFVDYLISLYERVQAIEQRLANSFVPGPVKEVDAKAGLYRQVIGIDADGQEVLSPKIPYSQHMGQVKAHIPPSVGQQMVMLSNGDPQVAIGIPMMQSNSNASPNDKGDENTVTFGPYRIDWKGDNLTVSGPKITFKCDGVTAVLSGSGLAITGGRLTHNGKSFGDDHRHGDVTPGNSPTGTPID